MYEKSMKPSLASLLATIIASCLALGIDPLNTGAASATFNPGYIVSQNTTIDVVLDGKADEWPVERELYYLNNLDTEAGQVTVSVSHNAETGILYVLVESEDSLKRVDIFLDVTADNTLDRPVQLIFKDTLSAAQAQHNGAVEIATGRSASGFVSEWQINLNVLGLRGDLRRPTMIGFDIEAVNEYNVLRQWSRTDGKFENKRRLNRLLLTPKNTSFGKMEGATKWAESTVLTPPARLLLRRMDNPKNRFYLNTNPTTGSFEVDLPVGTYQVQVLDSRTVGSAAPITRVDIKAGQSTLPPALVTRRPSIPLGTLTAELLNDENIRAIGIALVEQGEISIVAGYGIQANGAPVNEGSLFRMASVSKPVAAMIVMSLIEKGLWSLDEPLANYWIDPDINGDPRHLQLTTRRVLTHTTGLPNSRGNKPLTFIYDPNAKQSYSGEGFLYLRRAIEEKFGRSFQNIAEEQVFGPAGMKNSTFIWPEDGEIHYTGKFHGDFMFGRPEEEEANVRGGLLTTMPDLARFLVWVVNGAGLSDGLWEQITASNSRELLIEGEHESRYYGLGWVINDDKGLVLTHGGSERGARTFMVILPKERSAMVVATNSSGGLPAIRTLFEATLKKERPLFSVETEFMNWEKFDR